MNGQQQAPGLSRDASGSAPSRDVSLVGSAAREAELRALAERATSVASARWYNAQELSGDTDYREEADFIAACSPDVVLSLLDRLASLESRLSTLATTPTNARDTLHAAASDLRFVANGGTCDPSTLNAHADALLALSAQGDEGARDTARLDWMQEQAASATAVMDMDPEAEVGFRVAAYDGPSGEGATLRDAIDAAMSPTPTEEPSHE